MAAWRKDNRHVIGTYAAFQQGAHSSRNNCLNFGKAVVHSKHNVVPGYHRLPERREIEGMSQCGRHGGSRIVKWLTVRQASIGQHRIRRYIQTERRAIAVLELEQHGVRTLQ